MSGFEVTDYPLRLDRYTFERPLHTLTPLSFGSTFRAFGEFGLHVAVEIFVRIEIWTITWKLRAMSDIGAGPHRSEDIAERLGRDVTSLGPTRSQLIVKGMIWSPSHGDTAFTVPLFDTFMKRIMPGDEWRQ
jgi:hypothetical protein